MTDAERLLLRQLGLEQRRRYIDKYRATGDEHHMDTADRWQELIDAAADSRPEGP